jgi:hypothetical protein
MQGTSKLVDGGGTNAPSQLTSSRIENSWPRSNLYHLLIGSTRIVKLRCGWVRWPKLVGQGYRVVRLVAAKGPTPMQMSTVSLSKHIRLYSRQLTLSYCFVCGVERLEPAGIV